MRLGLIRVYTLGITGFDAPLLKSGVKESYTALNGIKVLLAPFLQLHARHADSVAFYMDGSLQFLQQARDFDSFDRLHFFSRYALPLQRNLGALIREMQLEQNTTQGVLNYKADHLFSKDAINLEVFPADSAALNQDLIALGRVLFYETALSGNNKISCATCHQPEKHFTDALPMSMAFDGHSHVKRNAPSLLYAAYQYAQFWDGRARSLEEQVQQVVSNPMEMNGNYHNSIQQLQGNEQYRRLFGKAFTPGPDSLITANHIAAAIAAFVRTLNPRSAPFDDYINGDTLALSSAQQRGFNLFMGKAQCGTCHFAPLFNGLIPPLYTITELEVLGTPGTDDLNKPVADTDNGRFNIFPIEYYEQAFKTPTVRNVSATGPYMHNGAFRSLENVVEFYNKGGGRGLGLPVPQQTLAAAPLQLTTGEVADIVSFLHGLEDKLPDNMLKHYEPYKN
ncbi:cytochrome C peroxidase [Chitinophaga agrisoli]|uniref:Cytochrome C peroxidase n=2 Tax=Chitinophaga agrisoli TaxID=2607653 RepID=A0A5B2VYL1_9BACT|nr:cytochrome C peroxidase [Chitinophaga agrisoli]